MTEKTDLLNHVNRLTVIYEIGLTDEYNDGIKSIFEDWKENMTKSDLAWEEFITVDLVQNWQMCVSDSVLKMWKFRTTGEY